jgi:hypothetical protein
LKDADGRDHSVNSMNNYKFWALHHIRKRNRGVCILKWVIHILSPWMFSNKFLSQSKSFIFILNLLSIKFSIITSEIYVKFSLHSNRPQLN